jgi:hypothetical protein
MGLLEPEPLVYLQKGLTDGFSKLINDAIASDELANDGFVFADSTLRVSRDSCKPKLTSKGFHHRCFPQFIGDSEVPDTLEGCLATCNRLKAVQQQIQHHLSRFGG